MRFQFEVLAELVLTYSWGLLVAGLVLTGMALFGYFNINTYRAQSCSAQPPFSCLSMHVSNESVIDVMVQSAENVNLSVRQVMVIEQSPPCIGIANATLNGKLLPQDMLPHDVARLRVTCTANWTVHEPFDTTVQVGYRSQNGSESSANISLHTIVSG